MLSEAGWERMAPLIIGRLIEAMSDDPDFEHLIVDSTMVWHQHAAGSQKRGG